MFKIIISSIVFLYMVGCMPVSVYRLNSVEKDKDIYKGVETVTRDDSTAKIILRFVNQSQDYYEFFISVTNNTSKEFVFDPKNIHTEMVDDSEGHSNVKFFAIDPEQKLKNIDRDINGTVAQKKTVDGINLFIGFLDLASTVATIGKEKSNEEILQQQEAREDFYQSVNNENINFNNKMNSLNDKKNYWEENVLRITKLYSGDEIDGEVLIPLISNADIVKIVVPVGGKEYNFLYKQTCSD